MGMHYTVSLPWRWSRIQQHIITHCFLAIDRLDQNRTQVMGM